MEKLIFAVFRPSEGKWYRRDSDGKLHIYEWGLPATNLHLQISMATVLPT
jgi:hypothetical protein